MTTRSADVATQPATARRRFSLDQRFVAPIFITLILLGGQLGFGILESFPRTLLAIAAAILAEIVLGRLFTGKIPHLASAYISGISVGILIRSPLFWPYALCSMIAITSKYLIRVKGRHLWNPSNLGIVAMLFLAHDSVATLSQQWGNSHWPMLVIWVLGSVIIARLKRFHICMTYVASFIAFALLRAALASANGSPVLPRFLDEVAPITGPMYQLFIFFMITDPKSTTQTRTAQIAVAFFVAAVECVLRLLPALGGLHALLGISHAQAAGLAVHAPYYALFTVGPAANLWEILAGERKSRVA